MDAFSNIIAATAVATAIAIVALLCLLAIRRILARNHVYFEPWADLRSNPNETLGRSVGELLLHELRRIQQTHERASDRVDMLNLTSTIPTFSQELNDELELLESVRLDSDSTSAVVSIAMFAVRTFPFLSPPCRLRGSIHVNGDQRRLQATLEGYRTCKGEPRVTRLWDVTGPDEDTTLPEQVRELAFNIYLDLLNDGSFTTWRCFAQFTDGLAAYVQFMELGRRKDRAAAQVAYRAALKLEPFNAVVSFNLGILRYMALDSKEVNAEAIAHFAIAMRSTNEELRTRAQVGMANALLTKWQRFRADPDRSGIEDALAMATEAYRSAPGSDVAAKALAYAHQVWWEAMTSKADAQPDPRRSHLERDRASRRGDQTVPGNLATQPPTLRGSQQPGQPVPRSRDQRGRSRVSGRAACRG